ncbi:uncharacterized protein [Coffea arabica]|uniref:CCHC-type domain-containing protein n=1 Tax=Coffea arabica TaxID=13443 RepID=A0ABM4VGV8_COFAR
MSQENELTIAQLSLKMDAMWKEMQRRLDQRLETIHEQIDHLSSSRASSRKSKGKSALGESSDSNADSDRETYGQGRPKRNTRAIGDAIKGIKMKIPPFQGKSDPAIYLEWESRVELVFDCNDYTDAQKLRLAIVEFTDYAIVWWEQMATSRRRCGEPPITTWTELKRLMKKRFVPSHYHRDLYQKLQTLTQGQRSVEDYYKDMEISMLRADIQEDREATMARFLSGLRVEIADQLELQYYVEIDDMVDKAIKIEQRLKRRGTTRYYSTKTHPSTRPFQPRREERSPNAWNSQKPKQDQGSSSRPPFAKTDSKVVSKPPFETSKPRSRDTKCWRCQGVGHIASQCRNPRAMLVLPNGDIVTDDEEEEYTDMPPLVEEEDEIEEVPTQDKVGLVARRALATQASKDELQRDNIFYTRCHVTNKECSLVIDPGSCTNVASALMVEKLNLPTSDHPRPYKLQWLNNSGEEYQDVFPEDIPTGLPPLRGIEHQIDFIPGSSLPNKAPYRTNPEETKEQQRQVEELLSKGWIQESLSPCAVPVLLVPKKDGGWRMCTDCRAINAITAGKTNVVADALSRRHTLITTLDAKLLGFEFLKEFYATDSDFGEIFNSLPRHSREHYFISQGFLYYKDKLCIPKSSMRTLLVREAHGGGLMGHFGIAKTLMILQEHFFWPRMRSDVERHIESHPQTDGQTEVVNRTLSTLLRAIIKKNIKSWEACLPHVEFAYNRTVHSATHYSPFEIVYGFNPLTPLDLTPLPVHERVNLDGKNKAAYVRELHTKVRANIEKRTLQYIQSANKGHRKMVFEPGDWVWIHMRKERFPVKRRSKLLPRGDGPFQVLERINDNAYKLELPGEYGVHATFNVSDLSPFHADDEFDLGTNRLQEEGTNEEGLTAAQTSSAQVMQIPSGPITRARARRIQDSLQALVCTIQERVGDDLRSIEGLHNGETTLYTFLQMEEPSEE